MKKTKKMIGGSTNNFSSHKKNYRRTDLSKKRGQDLNKKKRENRLTRQKSRSGTPTRGNMSMTNNSSNSSNNTIFGISDFPSLFDEQESSSETAIDSLSQTNNVTNQESILSLYSPQTLNSLVENSYRVKNSKKARSNFDVLRNEIKTNTDINDTMFRYGKPTQLINDFLYSLYNENIICLKYNEYQGFENFNFMMSIAELDGEQNTLYITISEEPLTPTDKNFYDKLGKLLHMVEIILFKSSYSNKRILMRGKIINDNYSYANGRITILDIDPENISKINSAISYKTAYRNFKKKYNYNETFIPKGSKSKLSPKKYDTYRTLLPDNLKIKFVFNTKYILERNKLGRSLSYRPFLKEDSKNPDFVACNSGSICSESKLFSYFHDNNLFSSVKGAIAYWVGKGTNFGKECHQLDKKSGKNKPKVSICNYHPNYSYEKNEETKEDLLNDMIKILKGENKISSDLLKRNGNKNFKNVFRAFALPCPGCYLNKENYFTNNRTLWNNSKCLEYNLKKRTDDKMLKSASELHPN
jgi:hypothetical protein